MLLQSTFCTPPNQLCSTYTALPSWYPSLQENEYLQDNFSVSKGKVTIYIRWLWSCHGVGEKELKVNGPNCWSYTESFRINQFCLAAPLLNTLSEDVQYFRRVATFWTFIATHHTNVYPKHTLGEWHVTRFKIQGLPASACKFFSKVIQCNI